MENVLEEKRFVTLCWTALTAETNKTACRPSAGTTNGSVPADDASLSRASALVVRIVAGERTRWRVRPPAQTHSSSAGKGVVFPRV